MDELDDSIHSFKYILIFKEQWTNDLSVTK